MVLIMNFVAAYADFWWSTESGPGPADDNADVDGGAADDHEAWACNMNYRDDFDGAFH